MAHSPRRIFGEPYPFNYSLSNLRWLLPTIFVVGTLFLYVFQPFNNNWSEHKYPFLVICMAHALAAIVALLPFGLLANLPTLHKNSWTIGKEISLMFFAFLIIGVANFLIRDLIYTNPADDGNLNYLLEEVKHSFAIGLIIYPLFVWVNYLRLNTKYRSRGDNLSKSLPASPPTVDREIQFYNNTGTLELQLRDPAFLFLKAEGNYITVVYRADGVQKKLIRSTLRSVAEQYPDLFQPHRSYLVNLNQINHISGNAQGYTLHFQDCDHAVPVSRNRKAALLERYQPN